MPRNDFINVDGTINYDNITSKPDLQAYKVDNATKQQIDSTQTISNPTNEYATDVIHVNKHYNAVGTTATAYEGSAIHARAYVGDNGTATVGTVHAISAQNYIEHCGNNGSEFTPLFLSLTAEEACRLWGIDLNINGPINTQADIMLGPVVHMGNYNPAPIANQGVGITVVTRPGTPAGDGASARSTINTYPINIGILVAGISGDVAKLSPTAGFDVGLQIGGVALAWMNPADLSIINTGILLRDIAGTGILFKQFLVGSTFMEFAAHGSNIVFATVNEEGGNLIFRDKSQANSWWLSLAPNGSVGFQNNTVSIDSQGFLHLQNSKEVGRAITQGATTQVITIPNGPLSDTNYAVLVTPNWGTTVWITNKTTTNFTVNFGTVAIQYAGIDWMITR